ncbi:MAG: gliding motility protein GldM [Prevotella sp.]|jgi:gliding motility-associated protein GldM|uniref:type IX secretion system motor protein PorM/GldM n=1 Tax=Prevotella sp. Rep29 TaxID=2691580 RepID=UPI001C6DFD0C|nr:gliding motility protein GldM [Prevotella sp. Rep29]MBR1656248.1 gliding motility protein GldM [Prevotella sp.]MBR3390306.1 gliding motility protein GldM [Prevotella sp.]MBR3445263.1 gliding motility protein GldM [Prevotella sp.]MBR7014472.1 gliding motility protein GldM [Prevotella sp.]MBR7093765.1 gliding motility protein GldM [Prevotella sp.]
MAIKKRPLSPRQKMINLMYVVLMAMLALNISTEVLNGFSIVEESLNRTTENSAKENLAVFSDLETQMKHNPEKVKAWFDKATAVKNMSDSLYNFAQQLKEAIVKEADGKKGDIKNIKNKDDLEAASHVMLAPGSGKGKALYDAINSYRTKILSMITDSMQRQIIASNLSTELPKNAMTMGKNWQEYHFEDMPVAAAVTLLSKLQSDIRYAEGEVLHTLVSSVDVKDIRVNQVDAFVIPEKTTLYPGERFSANIVMAAVDTTQHPEIYVNGVKVNSSTGTYSFTAGGIGQHSFSGYITMRNGSGEILRRDFTQKYEVISAPTGAAVAADLMNVLYAGYSNPMTVSVSGIPQNAVSMTMSGGTLTSKGSGRYVAVPTAVGKDAVFTVTANDKGKVRTMGTFTFKVRKLPDPTPYIAIGNDRFKGGGLAKASLMNVNTLSAAIDDGLLDIPFKVVSFHTVFYDNMGNAVPMASAGASFSQQQKEAYRKLSRNRRFYLTNITAIGPDGITRKLPGAMEIIVK